MQNNSTLKSRIKYFVKSYSLTIQKGMATCTIGQVEGLWLSPDCSHLPHLNYGIHYQNLTANTMILQTLRLPQRLAYFVNVHFN